MQLSHIDCDHIRLELVDIHRIQDGQRHLPPAKYINAWQDTQVILENH